MSMSKKDKVKELQTMMAGSDMSESVIVTVLDAQGGDLDKALDELLTLAHDPEKERREREERELRRRRDAEANLLAESKLGGFSKEDYAAAERDYLRKLEADRRRATQPTQTTTPSKRDPTNPWGTRPSTGTTPPPGTTATTAATTRAPALVVDTESKRIQNEMDALAKELERERARQRQLQSEADRLQSEELLREQADAKRAESLRKRAEYERQLLDDEKRRLERERAEVERLKRELAAARISTPPLAATPASVSSTSSTTAADRPSRGSSNSSDSTNSSGDSSDESHQISRSGRRRQNRRSNEEKRRLQADLDRLKAELARERADRHRLETTAAAGSSSSSGAIAPSGETALKEKEEGAPRKTAMRPPLVCLYTREGCDAQTVDLWLNGLEGLLVGTKGVPRNELCVVDATTDYEIQRMLQEKRGGDVSYPVIVVRGVPVGTWAELKLFERQGKLDALLVRSEAEVTGTVDPDAPELKLGYLDATLNVGEYVVKGVSSVLLLPITILTWPFSSGKKEPEPGLDFDVVHTNWYWRCLKRRFRFCDEYFMRIHPTHGDVRAVHKYETVARITLTDENNFVIVYNDTSSPDYIRAPEADVTQMIELIITNSPATSDIVIEKTKF